MLEIQHPLFVCLGIGGTTDSVSFVESTSSNTGRYLACCENYSGWYVILSTDTSQYDMDWFIRRRKTTTGVVYLETASLSFLPLKNVTVATNLGGGWDHYLYLTSLTASSTVSEYNDAGFKIIVWKWVCK